mgnify:FL=1
MGVYLLGQLHVHLKGTDYSAVSSTQTTGLYLNVNIFKWRQLMLLLDITFVTLGPHSLLSLN